MVSVRLLFVCAAVACAQDPFEIVIFEYEPMPRGSYSYEGHLNLVAKGTTTPQEPVTATNHQLHFSSEITGGITDQFRLAAVLLTGERPDHSLEYAGWRLLPHFYAPPSWGLPLNLGFVAEFSFQRATYEENTRRLELRGIVEKHVGRLELDFNPVFTHAFRGPATGWLFEPAGRVGWRASGAFTPSLEYYSSWGPAGALSPVSQQIHQLFPGGDWRISDRVTWSFGVGVGMTSTGSRVVLKSRFEVSFGKRH